MPVNNVRPPAAAAMPSSSSFGLFLADLINETRGLNVRGAFFILLGAATEGFGLFLLLPLVNVVSRAGFGNGIIDRVAVRVLAYLPGTTVFAQLTVLLGAFAVLMAIRAWSLVNRDVSLARLQTVFLEKLRIRVVEALARADWTFISQLRHGRISHVLSNDIRNCGLAAQLTLQSAAALVALAVQMSLALLLAPAIASIVLAFLAVGSLTLRPALKRSRQLGNELTESSVRLTDDTNQFLGGLKLAFSQNLQDGFAREFRHTVAYGSEREVAFARQRSIGQVALTSLAAAVAGAALLLGFGVFATSPAAMIALLIVLARMSGPAAQIQQNLQYIAHGLPAYEQIRGLESELDAAAVPREAYSSAGGPVARPIGDVRFEHVSFAHRSSGGGAAGIEDLDLVLPGGDVVGLTGASGAGKTTLLDLLVGLLVPDHGVITVNGTALNAATLTAWQDGLSYVSQDPYLFHDTIAGNLRWARPDADDAMMWRALRLAGADRLVAELPRGLATVVGERGMRLSGGERQRIALARGLIREPAMLILDEATNAIDVASERGILARLAAVEPRPTVVIVAHRDQSLAFCDHIVALEAGRLVSRPPPAPHTGTSNPAF